MANQVPKCKFCGRVHGVGYPCPSPQSFQNPQLKPNPQTKPPDESCSCPVCETYAKELYKARSEKVLLKAECERLEKELEEAKTILMDNEALHLHLLRNKVLSDANLLHLLGDKWQRMPGELEEATAALANAIWFAEIELRNQNDFGQIYSEETLVCRANEVESRHTTYFPIVDHLRKP